MSLSYFDYDSLQRWFADDGDNTHRLNYDITPNSIVIDVGGYEGDWAHSIFTKFGCVVYVFEPVKKYYYHMVNRFSGNNSIRIFNFALSNIDGEAYITHNTASSSVFLEGISKERITLKSLKTFLIEESLFETDIDLIKINIEGMEYDLLENMISENLHLNFRNIQIQFHKNIVDNCEDRRDNIRGYLTKSHFLTYDYTFVWENWKRKTLQ